MELRYRSPDGRVTWVSSNAVPLLGEDGSLQGHIGTVVDISEQKFAAEAIADSERTLRTVTDNMTDVIFVYGMDRRLQYVTPSFEKLTGFPVEVLRERNILGDVHPEDHPRMLSLWRGLFVGEPYTGAEFRIKNRDGTEKWCWSAGQPVYDADGVQIGVQIRDADISSRKRAELRVRESEERARSIIESTNEAFLAGDLDGTVMEWNPAAEGIFGWERDDVLGAEPGRRAGGALVAGRADGAAAARGRRRRPPGRGQRVHGAAPGRHRVPGRGDAVDDRRPASTCSCATSRRGSCARRRSRSWPTTTG